MDRSDTRALGRSNRSAERRILFWVNSAHIKTVKPRCILIFGRSNNWNIRQIETYRIMNAGFHNITIMTYDHVLERAKRIVGINPKMSAKMMRLVCSLGVVSLCNQESSAHGSPKETTIGQITTSGYYASGDEKSCNGHSRKSLRE